MTRSRTPVMLLAAALVCVGVIAPRAARAQELNFGQPQPTAAPKTFAVVAAADYTRLMEDVDYLSALIGMPQGGQMLRGMIAQAAGGPDLAGLDQSRPLGVVVQAAGFSVSPIVCLPVSDVSKLVEAASVSGFASEEMADGVTQLSGPGQPMFIKAQGDWVFGAQQAEALASLPADPAAQFQELVADHDLAVKLMAQDVPPMFKQLALSQIDGAMQQNGQSVPGETDEQAAARQEAAELSKKNVNMLIEGLDQLQVGLTVNPSAGGVRLDVRMLAVEGTEFARRMTAYQPAASRFAGFHDPEATFTIKSSGTVSQEALPNAVEDAQVQLAAVRQQIETALDEEAQFPNPEAKATVRSAIDDLLAALDAMIRSGRTDLAGSVRLDPDAATVIGAFSTPAPERVDLAVKKLAALVEEDSDFPPVKWNAYEHAGVAFHTLEVPIPAFQAQPRKVFGDSLAVAVGIGQESVYLAVGRDNLQAVSQAIDASQSGAADAGPAFKASLSLKSVADFAASLAEGPDAASAMMLAQALNAAPDPQKNRVTIATDITPNGLTYQIAIDEAVIAGAGSMATQMFGQLLGPMMQ